MELKGYGTYEEQSEMFAQLILILRDAGWKNEDLKNVVCLYQKNRPTYPEFDEEGNLHFVETSRAVEIWVNLLEGQIKELLYHKRNNTKDLDISKGYNKEIDFLVDILKRLDDIGFFIDFFSIPGSHVPIRGD